MPLWSFRKHAFDEHMAKAAAAGMTVGMGGQVGANGRYVYFETDHGHPGTVIELSEVSGPKGRLFDTIRAAGVDWDGRDPIRPFPDLNKMAATGGGAP